MKRGLQKLISGVLTLALGVCMLVGSVAAAEIYSKNFFTGAGDGTSLAVDHVLSERKMTLLTSMWKLNEINIVTVEKGGTVTFVGDTYQPGVSRITLQSGALTTTMENAISAVTVTNKGYKYYDTTTNEWEESKTLPAAYENDFFYQSGYAMSFGEDGTYLVWVCKRTDSTSRNAIVVVVGSGANPTINVPTGPGPVVSTPETAQAVISTATMTVNGKTVAVNAYNIGGNNYFKLRDVAYALNGTEKQFEVQWDATLGAINMAAGKSYTSVGGEMQPATGAAAVTAIKTTASIYLDGKQVTPLGYNIADNNYFKLRDLAELYNVGVTWDAQAGNIGLDTTTGYVPE